MPTMRTLALGVVVSMALSSVAVGMPAAQADPSGPVRPAVDGNRLVDTRTGSTWVPHGVNWPDLEYACVQGWIPSHPAGETQRMAQWGIDVVRLPLNQDCWLGVDGAPVAGSGTAAQYRASVAARVAAIHAAGMVAILDLHWTGPAGTRADGQRSMADAQSVAFWSSVAAAYRDDSSVMFELFNEPYSRGSTTALSWTCWAQGGCNVPIEPDTQTTHGGTYVVAGMDSLVAAVRATGARQPLLLGGRNYSNDLTGWLDHAPADDQLVAAWHNYPGQGCWTSCWNDTILTVAARVPVLMTEFGYVSDDPGAFVPTMEWADSHGIGYLPWAWWVTGVGDNSAASLYALVEGADYTPKSPAGVQFHDHLGSLAVNPPPDPPPDPDPGTPGSNPQPPAPVAAIVAGATAGAAAIRFPPT